MRRSRATTALFPVPTPSHELTVAREPRATRDVYPDLRNPCFFGQSAMDVQLTLQHRVKRWLTSSQRYVIESFPRPTKNRNVT
jgi:hypothetical protein